MAGAHLHTRWLLVRHPQPEVPVGMCYGQLEVAPIESQLHTAARRLAVHLPPETVVWTSPLQRCELLANTVKALRPDLIIETDPRIAELHFGSWEGRLWEHIGQAEMAVWTDDFLDHAPGGGESVRQLLLRVDAAWRDTALRLCVSPTTTVLWITHAGVVRALACLASGRTGGAALTAADWPQESLAFGEMATAGRFVGEARAVETDG
jgi:alpha-ribazole phosphatase